ncbi:MAG: ExeM/NucH family extracellular endonuclease, partial [Pseudomonadota bacterium]
MAGQAVEPLEAGRRVVVDGVVTADFTGGDGLDGFYIRGREPAPDGLPAGLFVYAPDVEGGTLEPGHWLRLTGRAGEYRGRLQLHRLEALVHCGEAPDEPLAVSLPLTEVVEDPARLEGVWVRIDEPLTVSGNRELARHGTLLLTAGGRAFQPTNFVDGGGTIPAGNRLLLDDGDYGWGADPIPHLDAHGTRRTGDRVEGLTGVLTRAFDRWRIHPTEPPAFKAANPRPAPLRAPAKGRVRVAAFNVENYFLTLGERGAATARERRRQRAKLLAAVAELDADVVALMEMENDPTVTEDFAHRLAERTGAPWRRVATDRGDGGDDAIRVALIHRTDRVERLGPAWRDTRRVHHRPPLVAGFRATRGGEPFAVAAVHFKARSGCPERGDVDRG